MRDWTWTFNPSVVLRDHGTVPQARKPVHVKTLCEEHGCPGPSIADQYHRAVYAYVHGPQNDLAAALLKRGTEARVVHGWRPGRTPLDLVLEADNRAWLEAHIDQLAA